MGVGYLHMSDGSVRYHVIFEQIGGHHVWIAALADDPSVRALGAREEMAVAALRDRLEAQRSAPSPHWSRQHQVTRAGWA